MWGALLGGPLHLRLCSFAGRMGSMVGCWGSRDWGLAGVSVAVVLSVGTFLCVVQERLVALEDS